MDYVFACNIPDEVPHKYYIESCTVKLKQCTIKTPESTKFSTVSRSAKAVWKESEDYGGKDL